MRAPFETTPSLSFWRKPILALLAVVAADLLFYDAGVGSSLGAYALGLVVMLAFARPAVLREPRALASVGCAVFFALCMADRPHFLALVLFAAFLGSAALLPRTGRIGDILSWILRLAAYGVVSVARPFIDWSRLSKTFPKGAPADGARIAGMFVLPIVGGVMFFGLFTIANPVISQALEQLRFPKMEPARAVFWAIVAWGAWSLLRARPWRRKLVIAYGAKPIPGVSAASVMISLLLFNALFALQNGLDIAFLWSGAPLPEGVTLAEYAHRGAYPLIVTALLAGLFVLVALRAGSDTAANRSIRALVVLWLLQNVFLVASSGLRTLDYVDAYSLTRFRISALLWMGLVAIGLLLIGWRMLQGKSAAWLINANAAAALVVLAGASIVDLGAVAAWWNVRHAREVDGDGAALDLCYLNERRAAALVSLVELERRPLDPELADRVAYVRQDIQDNLAAAQADWRTWSWRNARRTARVEAMQQGPVTSPLDLGPRGCDGRPRFDLRAPVPLTSSPIG